LIDVINLLHVPVQHPCYNFTRVMTVITQPILKIDYLHNQLLPSCDVQLVHLK